MSFSVVLSVQRLARTRPLLTSCLRLLSTSDPREDDLKSELVGIVSHLMVVGDKRKHLAVIITVKTELEERLTRKSNNTFFNRSMDFKFIHHNDDIYKCRKYKFREVSRLVLFLTLSPLSFSPSV